jgi:SAM-dependent methyltransferase
MTDSTQRFTDRVADYVAARPSYPDALAPALLAELQLPPQATVADLGSGTGLSCLPFLRAGCTVIGVEPNDAMRTAGDQQLATMPRFSSVKGTAEATTLPDARVDLVIAAQAAHWFEPLAAGAEARRILRHPPRAALVWNDRASRGDPFAEGYEALLVEHGGAEYVRLRHRHAHDELVAAFFGHGHCKELRFTNPTLLDFDTLARRLNSASYVPPVDTPGYAPMMAALRRLFDNTQRDGRVEMVYETRAFCGEVMAP